MIEKYPKKSKNRERYTKFFKKNLSNFPQSFFGTHFLQFHQEASVLVQDGKWAGCPTATMKPIRSNTLYGILLANVLDQINYLIPGIGLP
jgi:hypothetical protein